MSPFGTTRGPPHRGSARGRTNPGRCCNATQPDREPRRDALQTEAKGGARFPGSESHPLSSLVPEPSSGTRKSVNVPGKGNCCLLTSRALWESAADPCSSWHALLLMGINEPPDVVEA